MEDKRNVLQKLGDAYEDWKHEHPVADKTIKAGILFTIGLVIYGKGKKAGHETIVYKDNPDDKALLYAAKIKDEIDNNHYDIDEEIYSDLASNIEDAILEEGLDEWFDERNFTVKYPRFGDYSKGLYTAKKHVKVYVQDTTRASTAAARRGRQYSRGWAGRMPDRKWSA